MFKACEDGHHAVVLLSLACFDPWVASNSLDAVNCASGIGTGPFTNGISKVHVGSWRIWNIVNKYCIGNQNKL